MKSTSDALPTSDTSLIGFANTESARFAEATWAAANLPIVPIHDRPRQLERSELAAIYLTEEPVYNFPAILGNIARGLKRCTFVRGGVTRLNVEQGRCTSGIVMTPAGEVTINARFVALASGTQNGSILENTLGRFRASPSVRTSYMVVTRGPHLEPLAAIFPEHTFYGLFIVSRNNQQGTTWLSSNYLSYIGRHEPNSLAAQTWLHATLRTLDSLFPMLGSAETHWGIYSAPKGEFRRDPEKLPEGKASESFGFTNLITIWPTKISLAPLITSEVADRISECLRSSEVDGWDGTSEIPPVCSERWESIVLQNRRDFERLYCSGRCLVKSASYGRI